MKKKYTLAAEIAQARLVVENTLNHPVIRKKMAAYLYDRKKMMECKSLYEVMELLNSTKQDKYGIQYDTTDALHEQTQEVKTRYRRHLKIVRMVFEGQRGIEEQLKLKGRRKTDMDGWLTQVYTFYTRIEAFAEELSLYNISPEELAQTRAMVEALHSTRQQQIQFKADAQDATEKRDAARKELKAWMSRYIKTARLALQDDPQLLEALGILVPTKKV